MCIVTLDTNELIEMKFIQQQNGDMPRHTLIHFVIIYLCSYISGSNGKTFATCELFMELIRQGFPENQINDWICLIEAESSRRTEVIGGPDDDGSFDYGLFQINDRYWCNAGDIPGKGCNVTCSELMTEDITIASQCAQSIYQKQGFGAWLGWRNECMDKEQKQIDW